MAKKRVKRTAKQAAPSPSKSTVDAGPQEPYVEEKQKSSTVAEVDRWIAAIRASRDVGTDNLHSGLRLLRSYFSEEQLQTPVLKFFEENLPNFSLVKDGKEGNFDVQRKDNYGNSFMNQVDGGNKNASVLRRISSFIGLEVLDNAVKGNAIGVDNLQNKDFVLGETIESQMLGVRDTLQTPGVINQRLSIGMTPNTVRLPKHGEMLLSVHGSPLGVYKQENMEAINESEEG